MCRGERVGEGDRFANPLKFSQSVLQKIISRGVVVKAIPAHQLHGVEHATVFEQANVVDRNYAWMLKPGDDLRLSHHPFGHIRIWFRRVQNLDGNFSIEFRIFGAIDSAHAATGDLFEQAVLRRSEIQIVGHAQQMRQAPVREPSHSIFTPKRARASA